MTILDYSSPIPYNVSSHSKHVKVVRGHVAPV